MFVHTRHLRLSLPMEGGTTFHFTDEPVEAVLQRAFDAAAGHDVRLGGGAATVQRYLRAGLVDELHLVIVPILVGAGERLLADLGDGISGYRVVDQVSSATVTRVRMARR